MARRTCGSSWLTKSELAKVLSPPLFFNTFFLINKTIQWMLFCIWETKCMGRRSSRMHRLYWGTQDTRARGQTISILPDLRPSVYTKWSRTACAISTGITPLESLPLPFSLLLPNCAFIIWSGSSRIFRGQQLYSPSAATSWYGATTTFTMILLLPKRCARGKGEKTRGRKGKRR